MGNMIPSVLKHGMLKPHAISLAPRHTTGTHKMDELKALQALGLTIPSPAYIFGSIFFGIIGYIGYRHGKKAQLNPARWIGIALMVYPYAVSETWLLYVVGTALCAGLYAYRK